MLHLRGYSKILLYLWWSTLVGDRFGKLGQLLPLPPQLSQSTATRSNIVLFHMTFVPIANMPVLQQWKSYETTIINAMRRLVSTSSWSTLSSLLPSECPQAAPPQSRGETRSPDRSEPDTQAPWLGSQDTSEHTASS